LKDLQLLIKLKYLKIWSYIWEDFSMFQDVLNLDKLLKGSPILTVEENTEIFDAVHHFITGSRRFT
jgi:hypothetical protein